MLSIKIKQLYYNILKNNFLTSILTLSSGIIFAQIVNFIGLPLLSRLYSPESIGDYTVIVANANIIYSISCLGMMTALLLPETEDESAGLCKLVTYSTFIITTVSLMILWFIFPIYQIFSTVKIHYSIALGALWLFIISSTINSVCYAYANRLKMYRVMFWNPIINAIITVILGIVFGLLNFEFLGYTAAHVLAYIVNIIHLLIYANPYYNTINKRYNLFALLKSYRRFPIYQMPANLIGNLCNQIPILYIEYLYGATQLGLYSMALRILSLPTTLLATPINRVFFQEASQRYNRGEDIGEFSFKILETNIKLAIIPIILLTIFGREIFSLFLGKQWRMAGAYASILGTYQLMQFCAGCLSGYFVIIRKNSWNLIYSSTILLVYILIILIINNFFEVDITVFISLISGIMTLSIVFGLGIYFYYLNFSIIKYIIFLIKYISLPFIISIILNLLIEF